MNPRRHLDRRRTQRILETRLRKHSEGGVVPFVAATSAPDFESVLPLFSGWTRGWFLLLILMLLGMGLYLGPMRSVAAIPESGVVVDSKTNTVAESPAPTVFIPGLASTVSSPLSSQAQSEPVAASDLGVGASVLRMLGALILVVGLFLGGVWAFRRWQVLGASRGSAARLHVLEVRSLGARQTLYVVGYDRQRMLLASSPAGVQLISHLPESEQEAGADVVPLPTSFAAALHSVVGRKS